MRPASNSALCKPTMASEKSKMIAGDLYKPGDAELVALEVDDAVALLVPASTEARGDAPDAALRAALRAAAGRGLT